MNRSVFHYARLVCAVLLPVTAIGAPAATAAPRQLSIVSDSDLRFGAFAVMDDGYRIVSPTGAVQSAGLFSITAGDTAPARFTIVYDRGNNSRRRLDLRIQLVLSATPNVSRGGVSARLSSYRSDLPGAASVQAGRIVDIEIADCVQRVCTKSFHVGARLDVERDFGGGRVEIPIPVDAVLISVR